MVTAHQQPLSVPFPNGPAATPPPRYAELRETCPLAEVTTPAGDTAVLATRYDDIRQVLSDSRFSRDPRTPGTPRMYNGDVAGDPRDILNMDAPAHTRIRSLVQSVFSARQAETWRACIRQTAGELLDIMAATGPPADLVSSYAHPLPMRTICRIIGLPDTDRVREWSQAFLSTTALAPAQRIASLTEFTEYLHKVISDSTGGADNLIGLLLDAQEADDKLTTDEVVRLVRVIVVGGYETTASLIARGTHALLSHPDQLASLRRAPGLLPFVVEEIVRHQMLGPVGLVRTATEDVELGSGTIRAGQGVLAPYPAANHDPRRFIDPDRFDIHRSRQSKHMGFGHGSHFCLGAALARVELQEAIGTLVFRFQNLQPAFENEEIEWTQGHHLIAMKSLLLSW